ncbi:hypothetical protein [Kytococcus sedentarius]|uniref:hypothetical protein n=1 Tax=Kytococcus sedentarius TaxID=1276 RepID=UPI0015584E99|nr:hypothetical protein [Kytococcus sedentarius]
MVLPRRPEWQVGVLGAAGVGGRGPGARPLGALQAQGLDDPLDRGILLDDLKGLPLMGGLLTLVPALVGAMVGWVIRGLGGSGR